MFRNHLKVALRHFWKHKFVSAIHLIGLVIGMSSALFIWKYVHHEKGYDQFHEHADRIYRVRTDRLKNGEPFMQFAAGAACAGPVIQQNFPEVESYVKMTSSSEAVYASSPGTSFRENKVYYATPSLFEVFSFPLVQGDPNTCLNEPFYACISQSLAQKYFGDKDPIGKILERNETDPYVIKGVFADCPASSHIKFDMLLSYSTYSQVHYPSGGSETSAFWDGFLTYLLLKPNTDGKALEAKIPEVMKRTYTAETRELPRFVLQPLTDIHLTSHYLLEAEANGDQRAVQFLMMIGVLILVMAWVNFINLSTARARLRAREVGVKKVIGSDRKTLIGQFLTEAVLLNGIAMLGAMVLVEVLHPGLESFVGKKIPVSLFDTPGFWGITLGILSIGALLSGFYPAFLLSSFAPIQVLKSGFSGNETGGSRLRKALVIVQITTTVGLIASTGIIYQQLQFLHNKKLGIELDQMLIVKGAQITDSTFAQKARVFRQKVEQMPYVQSFTASTSIPGQGFGWMIGTVRRVGSPEEIVASFHSMAADRNYAEVYEMELAAGRYMSEELETDQSACMLNERGLKQLQFTTAEQAIGEKVALRNGNEYTIVGVLKDFHQQSPKSVVEPLLLLYRPENHLPGYYTLKLSPQELSQTLADIQTSWSQLFPGNPFEYFFLDRHFQQQYVADQRFGTLFTLFSFLAIFISCLGLFALITFTLSQRKKEVGIRKILGASARQIVALLSRDLIQLVGIGLVFATPVTLWVMQDWLGQFAYRIDLPWWMLLLAGILTLGIYALTVAYHSIRAARENPVHAIRNE